MDMYLRVRRACLVEGMSIREASRVFGLHRDTVRKMLSHPVPPGYRRKRPPHRPKLEPYTGVIDRILEDDLSAPKKQRHTAKRIFDRLKKEHGFDGGYTIVKDYVRERRRVVREMFVPLEHPPGHAQCDFGQAWAFIGGKKRRVHYFVMSLPHSDGIFIKAYPAETTEAFCDGHVSAFAFLGGVPQSILYDNSKIAVAKILGGGRRKRTSTFTELQSHYLFSDRFGRVGKGNDKGSVEGMVGYGRRNFLVPIPRAENFDELNAHLESECLERMDARLRGHTESIGERMERDLGALLALPAVPYDASDKHATRVSSQSLVSIDGLNILDEHIGKARDMVGYDVELMYNPAMSFNVEFAIRVAERLRKYGLRWLEEPLIPSDLEGHIELRKAINWVPLATGEDHHGRHAFRQLIEHRAIDIAQPDIKWCGGLSEAVKIYTIAEAADTPYGQHFSLAMPESPMAEFWMGSDPGVPLEEVCPIPGMPMPKDGYVIPSDAPGFGMEIKDQWVVPWDHTVAMKGLG